MNVSSSTERPENVLHTAAELSESGEEFVLITVVRTQGSVPRAAGAKMIWRPSGAALPNGGVGTVGGGQFEHLVIEAARACCAKGQHVMEKFVLGSDADQCCGGTVEVFLEYHGRPVTLVLFGAGHVAHATVELLAFAPVRVVVVDDRAEWNSPQRFARAERLVDWSAGVARAHAEPARTIALVMTCSHDTDLDVLRQLLAAPAKPPALTGLIGSRSKRACLFTRLLGAGIDPKRVERVACPIGVGDTGKEPRALAISVAAQVLMEAKTLAIA